MANNRENLSLDTLATWAYEYAKTEMIKGPRRNLSTKTIELVAKLSVHTLLLMLCQLQRMSLNERQRAYPDVRDKVWTELEKEYG